MSKMLTLGVILSAKDIISPIIGKTVNSFSKFNDKAKELQKNFDKFDRISLKTTFRLKDIDKRLEDLQKQKLQLEEKFKKGEISAQSFELKLRAIKNIEESLNAQRLKLKNELKESVRNADRLDRELKKISRKMKMIRGLATFGKRANIVGTIALGAGEFTKGWARTPIESFAELEDAQTQLKITLMDAQGHVGKWFALIDKQAKELGNKLPGTTADFYKIAIKLKSLGISAKSITGGVLRSAAYLAVVLKGMGVSYEEAAEATAKFREAMGISDKNLLRFIDLIQRTAYTGVKLQELQYAFSKVGATLKGIGISGYEAAKGITPLIGMLIKAGFSGESVGTNLGNIITAAMKFRGSKAQLAALRAGVDLHFTDSKGKFLGIEHMMRQLQKLKAIKNDALRLKIVQSIFGSGEAGNMANVLIQKGVEGYKEYIEQMQKQASINKKVQASLQTLSALWEAFTGTMTNIFAIVGEQVAPALKWLTERLNDLADWLTKFSQKHPALTKLISFAIVGFSGAAIAVGTLSIAFGLAARVFGTFLALANPVGLAIAAIAGGALLIYNYWEPITNFFSRLWSKVKEAFSDGWSFVKRAISFSPIGILVRQWGYVSKYFDGFWQRIKERFRIGMHYIVGIFTHPVNTIQEIWHKLLGWIGSKIRWIIGIAGKIKSFFGFGEEKKLAIKPAVEKLKPIVTAATVSAAVAAPTAIKPVHPATQPKSVSVPSVSRAAPPVRSAGPDTIVYNFHFGDLRLDIKDGKIVNPEELKREIERVIEEIEFHKKQRSLSDVM